MRLSCPYPPDRRAPRFQQRRCRGPLKPCRNLADVITQLDREFACKTSPGVKVAFGDANDDGNSAVDGACDQVAQAAAFTLDFTELVEDEKLRRMFKASLYPYGRFRQRRFVQTTSARAGAAVLRIARYDGPKQVFE